MSMRALLGDSRRKAVPSRLLVVRMGFWGLQKSKLGVWWGESICCGNGSGVQTLHRSMWVLLWPWPLNTAVSLLLGVITYQETGGKIVQEKWTRLLQQAVWDLAAGVRSPVSIEHLFQCEKWQEICFFNPFDTCLCTDSNALNISQLR